MQEHLDMIADSASEEHRKFRAAHWRYFYATETVVNGRIIPKIRDDALDRESFRLFEIKNRSSKAALDFEYHSRHSIN